MRRVSPPRVSLYSILGCEFKKAHSAPAGDAPKKVQHSSGREIGVNIKYLDNPFGIKYKLNGFELGGCHPFQIRRVYILFQKGWRDIDVALRQLFSISVHLYRSMTPAAHARLQRRDHSCADQPQGRIRRGQEEPRKSTK